MLGVKQKSISGDWMSAFSHKQTFSFGGERRRKAPREAGLTLLFDAHGRECPVCVLGAHTIVMGQFIIYVEPTNAFAIMNVFIGGVTPRLRGGTGVAAAAPEAPA